MIFLVYEVIYMGLKIGRNDLCPCDSGKKYKQCCLRKMRPINIHKQIAQIVQENNYAAKLAEILCGLLRYMKEKQWRGACHATSSVLFVILSELGYNPKLCVGEVRGKELLFDHSWIELDGKIIDLAILMSLQGIEVSPPIVLDMNTVTLQRYEFEYGISNGQGLDLEAENIMKVSFQLYMDRFPDLKNGLWDVVNIVLKDNLDISELRSKYKNVQRSYIRK